MLSADVPVKAKGQSATETISGEPGSGFLIFTLPCHLRGDDKGPKDSGSQCAGRLALQWTEGW